MTVSSPLVNVTLPLGFGVSLDGGASWIWAIGVNVDSPPNVLFLFPDNVAAATLWHVEDPAMWEWADSGPMNPPFDGEIAA